MPEAGATLDSTVIVKVADNVKIEMEKSAVTNVLKSAEG